MTEIENILQRKGWSVIKIKNDPFVDEIVSELISLSGQFYVATDFDAGFDDPIVKRVWVKLESDRKILEEWQSTIEEEEE